MSCTWWSPKRRHVTLSAQCLYIPGLFPTGNPFRPSTPPTPTPGPPGPLGTWQYSTGVPRYEWRLMETAERDLSAVRAAGIHWDPTKAHSFPRADRLSGPTYSTTHVHCYPWPNQGLKRMGEDNSLVPTRITVSAEIRCAGPTIF